MPQLFKCLVAVATMLALASCFHGGGMSGKETALAIAGKTDYAIVTGNAPTEAERYAAEELRTYLKKITGADFKAVAEKDAAGVAKAIYLGWTDCARRNGVDPAALGQEEWAIRTVGDNLVIAGGRPRGTLYGVYEFLEGQGGCAWLDEHVEVVPKNPDLRLPILDERRSPTFWGRAIYTGFYGKGVVFQVRNKGNDNSYDAKFGYSERCGSPGACHTFYAYSKDWPKDHPEYFSLSEKGERVRPVSGAGPGQLCLTNPEVRKLVLQKLRGYIKADREGAAKSGYPPPRIYDLSHNDDMCYCLCPGCKAVLEREGAYSGVLLDFVNEIARGIKTEYPDVIIQTFAYTFTLEPPKHIKPEANVMVQVCDLGSEWYPITRSENLRSVLHKDNEPFQRNVKDWAGIAARMSVWDYWKIYKESFPYTNVSALQPDMEFFADNRVGKAFAECEDIDKTSFAALKQWLGYKMLDNPRRPAAPLIKLFMAGYYGAAAAPMTEYLNYLERRIADTDQYFGRTSMRDWKYFDLEFFDKANGLLDEAEREAADNPAALRNVRRERVPVDFAALHLWEKLRGQSSPAAKAETIGRYERNRGEAIKDFYGGDNLGKELVKLSCEVGLFKAMPVPLPEQFKGKEVVDFLWPDFLVKEPDPDAAAGMAYKLGAKAYDNATAADHSKPMTIGVYDVTNKKFGPELTIKREALPQDGKYHWYKVGSFPVSDKTYLWTGYWLIQIYLTKAYQPPTVKTYDIHASVKVTGPAYVKGSKDENAIYLDRLVLVDTAKKE